MVSSGAMKKTILLSLVSFFIFAGCQNSSVANRQAGASDIAAGIVNGEVVNSTGSIQYLAVYVIVPRADGSSNAETQYITCTGSLIANDLVLTAAHCFNGQDKSKKAYVLFKRDNTQLSISSSEAVEVARSVVHPNYRRASNIQTSAPGFYQNVNDIALIQLSRSAPSQYVRMSLAPDYLNSTNAGLEMYAIGYGRVTGYKNANGEEGLLRFKRGLRTEAFSERSSYFLVDQKSGGVCQGDSGGPALYATADGNNIFVLGVTSAVFQSDAMEQQGADPCRYKAIYTKVSYYKSWIFEQARLFGSAL